MPSTHRKPILNTSLPAQFRQIRIELACEPGHPEGDTDVAYVIIAPLDSNDRIDPALWREYRDACRIARGMLAKTVTEAARFVAERGVIKEGAPILLKFVTQVAARFGLVVTQKAAAQALPIVGALGGAAVNYAFIDHFQDVARGHFTVRRLERLYGKERIRSEYDLIAGQL
jgi:hypothetical protein